MSHPMHPMPPTYSIKRTLTPPPLDGHPCTPPWPSHALSPLLNLLPTDPRPVPQTDIRLLYDDTHLYISAFLHEPHITASITTPDTPIFHDNDFEIFIDPDGSGDNYYEFEINALATTWQLSLSKPYYKGGVATSPQHLPGLRSSVWLDGQLNDPDSVDRGWAVYVALELKDLVPFGAVLPVRGRDWRMNFSRVQWQHQIVDGEYQRVPPRGTHLPQGENESHPEQNCVWASTGVLDIHRPEHWGVVNFV